MVDVCISAPENEGDRTVRYMLRFLGSVEVSYHKGNDVLCQAIHKVWKNIHYTLVHAIVLILLIQYLAPP